MCGDQPAHHRASWWFAGELGGLVQRSDSQHSVISLSLPLALASFWISQRKDSSWSLTHPSVLLLFICYNKALLHQECTPHSFGGWNSEMRVPAQLGSGKGPFYWLQTIHSLLSVSPHGRRGQGAL